MNIDMLRVVAILAGVNIMENEDGIGEPARFAIVEDSTHTITNFVMLRNNSSWVAPEGHTAYMVPEGFVGDIGWREVNGEWVPPSVTTPETILES
jgi:hypothetical protein